MRSNSLLFGSMMLSLLSFDCWPKPITGFKAFAPTQISAKLKGPIDIYIVDTTDHYLDDEEPPKSGIQSLIPSFPTLRSGRRLPKVEVSDAVKQTLYLSAAACVDSVRMITEGIPIRGKYLTAHVLDVLTDQSRCWMKVGLQLHSASSVDSTSIDGYGGGSTVQEAVHNALGKLSVSFCSYLQHSRL